MRIAWIGSGVMGAAMAGHLVRAGHALVVHTRTRARAQSLIEGGAEWAESPAAAADGAEMAISMVGYPDEVEEVHLGGQGTLSAARRPGILVDMSTSTPSLARRIAEHAAAVGSDSLDAPVTGGDVGAREARLSIMVGGSERAFESALPVLRAMGTTVVRQGGPGAGQHAKAVNQILIASCMAGIEEGIRYAGAAGLDVPTVLSSISQGAAGSWSLANLLPRAMRGDFAPGFAVDHFAKDLGIALGEARSMRLPLPLVEHARGLYEALRASGAGRQGTHALWRGALEGLAAGARIP